MLYVVSAAASGTLLGCTDGNKVSNPADAQTRDILVADGVAPDSRTTDATPHDGSHQHDGSVAECPGGAGRTGFCTPPQPECRTAGGQTCSCAGVCSGVAPPPGEAYAWWCRTTISPNCPPTAPADGTACQVLGQNCFYGGPCSGKQAVCQASGQWKVTTLQPPP
ncbi:MAG: hypothetical protein H6707_18750 [Deltaproteobacteria bacterium]|nr:hypothetical protein [Deltaproteobacteria bacterium]